MRSFALGVLCLFVLHAQEAVRPPASANPPETAKPATPADRKAFQAAQGQKDPAARITELDKFLKDFPASSMASIARREIVNAALKVDPSDAVRRTKALTRKLAPTEAAALNRFLAAELVSQKKLLPDAEKASKRAVKQFKYAPFAAEARRDAEQRKAKSPSEDQIRARYNSQLAQMKETAGQALMERGKTGEAKRLLEDALNTNPSLTASAASLGAISEKAGKTAEALDLYAHAMLAKPSPDSRKRFNDSWAKVKGSVVGQQEYLDQRHKTLFPNPLHPSKYVKSAQRTERVVLGEEYTGSGCPPCVAANLAFEAMLDRYPRTDFALIIYHEHIPRPDPMTNPDTLARWKWQQGRGVPTYTIDGEPIGMGGGPRDAAPEIASLVQEKVDKQLDAAPAARIELSTSHDGRAVNASVNVSSVSQDSPGLVLNIVLVEKELTYSGENGIRFHPMVARAVASFALNVAKSKTETRRFDLAEVEASLANHIDEFEKHDERHNKDGKFRFMERKTQVNPAHLAVVAFVQDAKTRQVLQSAYSDAKP